MVLSRSSKLTAERMLLAARATEAFMIIDKDNDGHLEGEVLCPTLLRLLAKSFNCTLFLSLYLPTTCNPVCLFVFAV